MSEQKQQKAARQAPLWLYKGLAVRAWTKSEARAILKGKLGRLPAGAGAHILREKE